jgi:hypothetical protein
LTGKGKRSPVDDEEGSTKREWWALAHDCQAGHLAFAPL